MHSLLTGKHSAAYRDEAALADKPLTADDHHSAIRRLLVEASVRLDSGDTAAAAVLVAAARVHAEEAKTAGRTPLPVKTAPARTTPHGDAI